MPLTVEVCATGKVAVLLRNTVMFFPDSSLVLRCETATFRIRLLHFEWRKYHEDAVFMAGRGPKNCVSSLSCVIYAVRFKRCE